MFTATAWLVTADGLVAPVHATNGTLRKTIEQTLKTKLLGSRLIVPDLYIWNNARTADSGPINAAALGLIDLLLDPAMPTLPRIRGDVVLAGCTHTGEPGPIGRVGMRALLKAFPVVAVLSP